VDALLEAPAEVRHALAAVLSRVPGPLARRYLAILSSDPDVLVRLEARSALIERESGKRR
jgi:HEAT repeat protein